jgi:hypothetical protein
MMVVDSPVSLEDSEEACGARACLASRPSMPGSVRRKVVSRGGAVSRLSVQLALRTRGTFEYTPNGTSGTIFTYFFRIKFRPNFAPRGSYCFFSNF